MVNVLNIIKMVKKKLEGFFINDKIEGDGYSYSEDGSYFFGHFTNGKKNGFGKEFYNNDGIKYEGNFIDDLYEGIGTFINEEGLIYIGPFKNGKKNGRGIIKEQNGNKQYEGLFKDDQLEEIINEELKNENIKIGILEKNGINDIRREEVIKDNQINYYGNIINKEEKNNQIFDKDGNIYFGDFQNGDFMDGKFEGFGKQYLGNGEYYIGNFKNNKRNGHGILYNKEDQIIYEGDFSDDKIEGKGKKYNESDGLIYEGDFVDGKYEGEGKLYLKENLELIYTGKFENNVPIDKEKILNENNKEYSVSEDEPLFVKILKAGIKGYLQIFNRK